MDKEEIIRRLKRLEHTVHVVGEPLLMLSLDDGIALYEAVRLLKEQEAVEPITEHHLFLCPVCKNTLFREQKYCHECGKRIEWKGL